MDKRQTKILDNVVVVEQSFCHGMLSAVYGEELKAVIDTIVELVLFKWKVYRGGSLYDKVMLSIPAESRDRLSHVVKWMCEVL
jgi:hypothetical protein